MGERKGTNHYYPPDYDPGKGGLNKFLGTHALRERARKIHLGILIIRFEMPYNIWCNGCGNHIGMGVRYNAEKKKVGMYYSTPVYQFRMKCHLCDNHFEIKTDPGNLDYIIVSGARRQENRWDPTQNGQVVPEEKATQKRLFDDAMFKLEHGKGDESVGKSVDYKSRSLIARRDELWQDDFSANSMLRSKFRAVKRAANASELKDKVLLKKFGLDMKLVPEHESDVKLATLLSLKPSSSITERLKQTRADIINRPVLPSSSAVLVSKLKSLTNGKSPTNSRSLIECKSGLGLVRKKCSDAQAASSPSRPDGESDTAEPSPEATSDVQAASSPSRPDGESDAAEPSPEATSDEQDSSPREEECGDEKINVSLVSCLYNNDSSSSE